MVLPSEVRGAPTSDSLQLSEGQLPTPKPHVSLLLTPLLGAAAVRLREKIREPTLCNDPDERQPFFRPLVIISLSLDFFERWLMSGWIYYRVHLGRSHVSQLCSSCCLTHGSANTLTLASTWTEASSQPHPLCLLGTSKPHFPTSENLPNLLVNFP